jgi:hypothetical protein
MEIEIERESFGEILERAGEEKKERRRKWGRERERE